MLDVVIDRKTWGHGIAGGYLLQDNGKMCCLGFICKEIGMEDSRILDFGLISTVFNNERNEFPEILSPLLQDGTHDPSGGTSRQLQMMLVDINDNQDLTAIEKERRIIETGKKADINFSFVN